MNNFRKTLAYKICGYLFFVLVAIAVLFVLGIMSGVAIWRGLMWVLVSAGALVIASKIMLLLLIILSIIAFLTQKKYTNAKPSVLADIGYVCMLIMSCVAFYTIKDEVHTKKILNTYQTYLQNDYPIVAKNSCIFFNNHLPKIIEKLGGDFTIKQLANELEKIETVTDVKLFEPNNELRVQRKEPTNTFYHGKTHEIIIAYRSPDPCDLQKRNCHIYLVVHNGFGDCRLHFDKNGKTAPTEETLQLIQ